MSENFSRNKTPGNKIEGKRLGRFVRIFFLHTTMTFTAEILRRTTNWTLVSAKLRKESRNDRVPVFRPADFSPPVSTQSRRVESIVRQNETRPKHRH